MPASSDCCLLSLERNDSMALMYTSISSAWDTAKSLLPRRSTAISEASSLVFISSRRRGAYRSPWMSSGMDQIDLNDSTSSTLIASSVSLPWNLNGNRFVPRDRNTPFLEPSSVKPCLASSSRSSISWGKETWSIQSKKRVDVPDSIIAPTLSARGHWSMIQSTKWRRCLSASGASCQSKMLKPDHPRFL